VNAAIAAQAITGGVARAVSVRVTSQLDTHQDNWATAHGDRLEAGFEAVARLIEDLASRPYGDTGRSWLDHTVILGFSEFSRTPLINDQGGRDHHFTNACFLAGGAVRGGQVIGASSDVGMLPMAVDLNTGALDPAGEVVRPEHILQTLFGEVGIGDEPDLRVSPLRPLLRG
jgi:uncharacterized protein (DUF1501 family)